MSIDSNVTKMAVTIFVQEILSEATLWMAGGDGRFCGLLAVNGSSMVNSSVRCTWYEYPTMCQYRDPNATAKIEFPVNMDACGWSPSVGYNQPDVPKFACLIGYTRNYEMSDYNCRINGMKLFNIGSNGTEVGLNRVTEDYIEGKSGINIWLNGNFTNGTCAYFDGNYSPFRVGSADCESLFWSYCENPIKGK